MEQDVDYYNTERLTGKELLAIMIASPPTDLVNTLPPHYSEGNPGRFVYKTNKGAILTFSILENEPQIPIHGPQKQRELTAKNLPKILGHDLRLIKLPLEQNVA